MTNNNLSFKSNDCIAIGLSDLKKAKEFYGNLLGFKLVEEKENLLAFDTGHFILYVDKNDKSRLPIPSFIVDDIEKAKTILSENNCKIITGGKNWFWFEDPFGIVYDIIQK
jgi:catechol 2,3-dioxygenase-like lactoylglutathione lyase family enzyme